MRKNFNINSAILAVPFSEGWSPSSRTSSGRYTNPSLRPLTPSAQKYGPHSIQGDRTAPFWSYVYPTGVGGPTSPKPGAHLFTKAQLVMLANLPGELG